MPGGCRRRWRCAAAQVAAHVRTHAPTEGLYLAAGGNFPDALATGALLPTDTSPILLAAAGLTPATADAAEPASRATVMGGPAVITDDTVEQLAGLGIDVQRVAGTGRYETSAAALDLAMIRLDGAPRPLLVATGAEFPDALAASALAGRLGAPVLLIADEGLAPAQIEVLARHGGRFDEVIGIGGAGALPTSVLQQVAGEL